ncbi:protein of unknown function DUF4386 containing protein [Nitzschia inconspicua]|uniref:DUF4386 domain-containing protein n=1 Tax=Nitzschia inconspicua TaxID=303405 RepID=A0A9K3Q1N6_9STRA|nr:protein of unknown function DUF4386 containing protein [Nitzschia inconspicua]
MTEAQSSQQFVQMSDEEAMYQEEVQKLEKRGKRLRRAALTAGIFSVVSIICTIYTTIAVRWVLIEWQQPEKTAYEISESMPMYKFGIIGDIVVVISDTLVGVLLGLILIGAGVNPATSSILIAFKLIQQAINGANVLFSIAAGLMLDENLPIYEVVQKYFYSDNMPPIGTQIAYMFLMLNQYGHYFMQIFGGVFFGLLGFTIVLWGVFPRWMGYIMSLAGFCYILNSSLFLFWPGYDGTVTFILLAPALITHFWLAGWLLVNTPHPSKNRDLWSFQKTEAEDEPASEYEAPEKPQK